MFKRMGFSCITVMAFLISTSAYPQMSNMRGGMMMDMMQMDRHFIERMIPHHQDAIAMAKLALDKSKKAEIKKLANDIIKSQTSEIETMKKWYKEWFGANVPAKPVGRHAKGKEMNQGMMMMDMSMSHDMMGGTIDDLEKAPDFDRKFLEMMVKHHKMAVPMSGMVLDSKKAEMRQLAREIITAQSGEIEMMIKWYTNWYGGW